jgi:hypothetical protein
MSAARQDLSRAALVALLQSELVGTNKPTQFVYNGLPSDFGGVAPVIMVTDSGIGRSARELTGTRFKSRFKELLLVWVADADDAAGWTDTDAENQQAQIEAAIADVIAANRRTADWNWIGHDGDALPDTIPDAGGKSYLVLAIPITMEVLDA